jgi:hypothetical protein
MAPSNLHRPQNRRPQQGRSDPATVVGQASVVDLNDDSSAARNPAKVVGGVARNASKASSTASFAAM